MPNFFLIESTACCLRRSLLQLLFLLLLDPVIGKEVKLLADLLLRHLCLVDHMVGGQVETAHRELCIRHLVKQLERRLDNFAGGGGVVQMDSAGGVLGDGAAIAVGAHLPMILPAALPGL